MGLEPTTTYLEGRASISGPSNTTCSMSERFGPLHLVVQDLQHKVLTQTDQHLAHQHQLKAIRTSQLSTPLARLVSTWAAQDRFCSLQAPSILVHSSLLRKQLYHSCDHICQEREAGVTFSSLAQVEQRLQLWQQHNGREYHSS